MQHHGKPNGVCLMFGRPAANLYPQEIRAKQGAKSPELDTFERIEPKIASILDGSDRNGVLDQNRGKF